MLNLNLMDVQIYIGHFPDPLKKAEQNISEADLFEKIMKKHFVEEDSKKKTTKFNWPSIPVEANIYQCFLRNSLSTILLWMNFA